MKSLTLLLALFLLFSCNNDDDIITPPEPDPEPIIANAKVLRNGTCGEDHYFIEINDIPSDSLPTGTSFAFYSFYDWPEEYRIENLEIYLDYRNANRDEARACNQIGPTPHRFVAREILLSTE